MKTLFTIIMSLGLVSAGLCDTTNEPATSSQPQSEAEMSQKIVGTWVYDSATDPAGGQKETLPTKGTETYSSNGDFSAKIVVARETERNGGTEQEKILSGTWSIHNGKLVAWTTNASGKRAIYENPEVVRVDDNELITLSTKYKIIRKRIK